MWVVHCEPSKSHLVGVPHPDFPSDGTFDSFSDPISIYFFTSNVLYDITDSTTKDRHPQ
jgi:hypothetical protein